MSEVTVREQLVLDLEEVLKEGGIANGDWAKEMAGTVAGIVQSTLILSDAMMEIYYTDFCTIHNQIEL